MKIIFKFIPASPLIEIWSCSKQPNRTFSQICIFVESLELFFHVTDWNLQWCKLKHYWENSRCRLASSFNLHLYTVRLSNETVKSSFFLPEMKVWSMSLEFKYFCKRMILRNLNLFQGRKTSKYFVPYIFPFEKVLI